ncbi:type III secretory flagellar biosynthesis Yop translocation U domain protein, partial [Chlamydia psittaci 03DC29]
MFTTFYLSSFFAK